MPSFILPGTLPTGQKLARIPEMKEGRDKIWVVVILVLTAIISLGSGVSKASSPPGNWSYVIGDGNESAVDVWLGLFIDLGLISGLCLLATASKQSE